MSTATLFDFAPLLSAGLPAPAARWTGLAKYSFVGGNNDPDQVPVDGLIDAINAVLRREGRTLATYGLASGPQGYRPLREFLTAKLKRDAGIACTADDIMIVSGSLQALDLVNQTLLARGDTVLIEQETYQGSLNRLTRLGVKAVGIPLDEDGMRMDALAAALADHKRRGITPKYIYTIPTVQNPTGNDHAADAARGDAEAVARVRRADLRGRLLRRPDLDRRAPARDLRHEPARRRHPYRLVLEVDRACPARRFHRRALGDDVADAGAEDRRRKWRAGADGAGGILRAAFRNPCPKLTRGLRAKLDTLMEALNEQFGTSAEFDDPKGGIFLWVKLPDNVDTLKLYQAALAAGVAINPGPEWSTDKAYAGSRLRLCFASPSHEQIREGVAVLAEVCRKEFGVPERSANVEKRARI